MDIYKEKQKQNSTDMKSLRMEEKQAELVIQNLLTELEKK
jgi:hypothetical protein